MRTKSCSENELNSHHNPVLAQEDFLQLQNKPVGARSISSSAHPFLQHCFEQASGHGQRFSPFGRPLETLISGSRTRYLIDEADGWGLTAIEELHVDDLELLQADVKSLQLLVLTVQGDDLEEAIVEPQANHPALWVNDADDTGL